MDLCKLFVGGISWETNEDRLREYFQTFGEVLEAVIMKDRTTGRARGFGFVVFADLAVAERVLSQKHMIDGKTVEAKKAVPRDDQTILSKFNSSIRGSPGPAPTKKIFVGGLASSVTEAELKKYFAQFGTITDIVVMHDHKTQRPRGFGFITYNSEEAMDKVLQKTFHELNSKMVEVKQAVPKERYPGPNRNHLGGHDYGSSRFSSFLTEYTQGYSPNLIGAFGVKTDGRYSPGAIGRGGFSPYGHVYGVKPNFDSNLNPNYGMRPNSGSNLNFGQSLGPSSYNVNLNRYGSPRECAGGNPGSCSTLNHTTSNLWGNVSFGYAPNSLISDAFMSSLSGNSGIASLGCIGEHLGSYTSSGNHHSYSNENFSVGSGLGFGKGTGVAPESLCPLSNGGYDGNCLLCGDPTWRSSPSELEGSRSFGCENGVLDFMSKSAAAYDGDNNVASRQPNGAA